MKKVEDKKEWSFDDIPKWQKLIITISGSILVLLIVVLCIIMPIVLAFTQRSLWFLLLYIIPIGIYAGVELYSEL